MTSEPLRCPDCGHQSVETLLYRDDEGKHQHTLYQCHYWGKGLRAPCGWTGWSVSDDAIQDLRDIIDQAVAMLRANAYLRKEAVRAGLLSQAEVDRIMRK